MNPVSVFAVVNGVMLYSAFAWKVYQLCRAPRDVPLRIVTICLAFGAAFHPVEVILGHDVITQVTSGPIPLIAVHEILLQFLIYALICFFLYSALDGRRAAIRARREAIPLLVLVTTIMVAALSSVGRDPLAPSLIIFLAGDLYTVYGFSIACFWACRYRQNAGHRLRRGLLLTATGLGAMALSAAILIGIVLVRWSGTSVPAVLPIIQSCLLLPGIGIFIIGVTYPGAAMRLAALRVWWRHLRAYHHLTPLWTTLHESFPEDTLHRAPRLRWLDRISLRGVHHRYYRRVIECRDGLVRLSPYIATSHAGRDADNPPAAQVRNALRTYPSTEPAPAQAVPIAKPADDSLDADAHELVALSQALNTK